MFRRVNLWWRAAEYVRRLSSRQARKARRDEVVACSNCFANEGLRLDAERLGSGASSRCPRCGTKDGRKFTPGSLITLGQHFFVWGSVRRFDYGAAPAIQFNDRRQTEISLPGDLERDARVFEEALGAGFFAYEPRLWLFGEVEPLKRLRGATSRDKEIDRILREYGSTTMAREDKLYRIRKKPDDPCDASEYDSAPRATTGSRLATSTDPVLYTSADLQTCLHECRVSAEDDIFVATLRPKRSLRLLDLAGMLDEPFEVDEFDSLDLAVNMLFLAGKHSYPICREIAKAARREGFDGLVYPSYFSMLRNGVKPFETTYGISHRKVPQYREFEDAKTSRNMGIFGRPVDEGLVEVECVNRVVLSTVAYSVHFGPALDSGGSWRAGRRGPGGVDSGA